MLYNINKNSPPHSYNAYNKLLTIPPPPERYIICGRPIKSGTQPAIVPYMGAWLQSRHVGSTVGWVDGGMLWTHNSGPTKSGPTKLHLSCCRLPFCLLASTYFYTHYTAAVLECFHEGSCINLETKLGLERHQTRDPIPNNIGLSQCQYQYRCVMKHWIECKSKTVQVNILYVLESELEFNLKLNLDYFNLNI